MTTKQTRDALKSSKRWVVKLGSSLVTAAGRGLDQAALSSWSEQIVALRAAGCEMILVSSGAVAEGIKRLGWTQRPKALFELQAAAAVGQAGLIEAYERCFRQHQLHTAQILLTRDDLSNRQRYLNARSTLRSLLQFGVIPIINENDTVANDEIRLGDNDTLAALVANLIEADLLVLLTDQAGLYDKNPKLFPDATLISHAQAGDPQLDTIAGPSISGLGRGGMSTKVSAAQRAARSGTTTIIAAGSETNVLLRLRDGEPLGTLLSPVQAPLLARKQWLANQLHVSGRLTLDAGASAALLKKASLLSIGVTQVDGEFKRGELVACLNHEGKEIARGLINYSAAETRKLLGRSSKDIESILGYLDKPELIDRDNLVLSDRP